MPANANGRNVCRASTQRLWQQGSPLRREPPSSVSRSKFASSTKETNELRRPTSALSARTRSSRFELGIWRPKQYSFGMRPRETGRSSSHGSRHWSNGSTAWSVNAVRCAVGGFLEMCQTGELPGCVAFRLLAPGCFSFTLPLHASWSSASIVLLYISYLDRKAIAKLVSECRDRASDNHFRSTS